MSSASPQIVRVSVIQACTDAYSLPRTLDKLERLTRVAKERDNAQLVVFPEGICPDCISIVVDSTFASIVCLFKLFVIMMMYTSFTSIGGYPKMSTFGAVVGERSPDGRDEFVRYHSAAIEIPSPAITSVERISRVTSVFIVVGVIERDGGTLYCTAVFVDPVEGFIGKHRKLVPTATERLIWGQGDASTLPILERSFRPASDEQPAVKAKLSAAICWENYMPLLRNYYYSQGTQIYCAPTVDARPAWQHSMVHIALEGRCFVLSACQFAQEKDYPADHPVADASVRNGDNVMIAGGSMIVSPLGKVLAGPLLGEEGVLTADLDLHDCIRGKFDLDVTGHYSRPDVFGFKAFVP